MRIEACQGHFIAKAGGLFHSKRLFTGSLFENFSYDVKQAILVHEEGHIKGWHSELRLLAFFLLPAFLCHRVLHWTEYQADAYAVSQGHAEGLLQLLHEESAETFWHPSHADRKNRITLALHP